MPPPAPLRTAEELCTAAGLKLGSVADPTRAPAMVAYMKGIAPFLGVASPARRTATKTVRAEAAQLDEQQLLLFAALCFDREREREYAYVAIDVLERRAETLSEGALPSLRKLCENRSWWDTVDALSKVVGAGVKRFASWKRAMDEWSTDNDLWIRRVAILHQLGEGHATDTRRMFRIILRNAADREFFIRKAIGWALRDLAWKQPDVVAEFVEHHRAELSPLSVREATRNLPRLLTDR
jgi:3-methyladenine DNA glycosylase AlkD